MHADRGDQLRLEDQICVIRDQYQKENDAFDMMVDCQGMHKNLPATLPCYSRKERIKYQVFFNTWKSLLEAIRAVQKTISKACKWLWNSSDDLLEEFMMKLMPPIDEATLAKTRIVEVEEHRGNRRLNIEH
jgi:hypothetical protein